MRKGQISIETISIFTLILIIGIAVILGINQRNLSTQVVVESLQAQREAEKLANAINDAVVGGNGFDRNVTIRRTLGVIEVDSFKIIPAGRIVQIEWKDVNNLSSIVAVPILTSNLNGSVNIALTRNLINVKNIKTVIQITEQE